MTFIADLIACSTCFRHPYAHHQELESIIQVAAVCGIVSGLRTAASHHTDNLKTEAPNTTGSSHLYNTLELLMMGILVPETCWASNKICNKNHLLHLVGILFPHINEDARSKSLQMGLHSLRDVLVDPVRVYLPVVYSWLRSAWCVSKSYDIPLCCINGDVSYKDHYAYIT